jgi:glycerophosphoryl diester phosphodiesterase
MPLPKHQLLEPGFRTIAYRGGGGELPENTLEAIANAAQSSGVVVELDVRRTADGELVAMHDELVERTTDGAGAVSALSYSALAKLNAGHNFERKGQFPYRHAGLRVPKVADILAAFPNQQLVLDVHSDHPEIAAEIVRLVRQQRAAERVVIASEISRVVHAIRRAEPRWLYGGTAGELLSRVLLERVRLDGLAPRTGGILMIPESHKGLQVLSPRFLERAHARGERVWVWVVESIEDLHRLRNLGVDGVFTPTPSAFIEAASSRGVAAE